MIFWLIPVGYLAIALTTWRIIAIKRMETAARDELNRRNGLGRGYDSYYADKPLLEDYERLFAISDGAMVGFLWPIALPIGALYLLGRSFTRGWEAPAEKRQKERAELEALRKLARDNNLPMPEQEQP